MIRAAGAKHLFEAIKGHKTLTSLDVSSNEIGAYSKDNDGRAPWIPSPEGPAAIADGIKNNGALVKFDVSTNSLCAPGGKLLAEALKGNNVMQELNIAGNSLGKAGTGRRAKKKADMSGVIAIGDAIPTMGALTNLNMSNNALGGYYSKGKWISDITGIKALAAAIPTCK